MSLDNFKKTGLGEKIDSHEFDFDPAAWEDMEVLLDGEEPTRKIFPFFLWFKILGGLVFLMALAFFFFNKKDTVKPVQEISEIETVLPEVEKTTPLETEEKTLSENIGHSTKTENRPSTIDATIVQEQVMKINETAAKKTIPNSELDLSFLPGFSEKGLSKNGTAPYLPVLVWENADKDFISKLKNKLVVVNQKLATEKVYLQFDKTQLKAGEKISFSAFVRDANSMAAVKESDMKIEVSNQIGEILVSEKVSVENGVAVGELKIPEIVDSDILKIKAFSKNEKLLFESVITVMDAESISSIPTLLKKIDLRFFPEGGDLVEDFSTKVAFKAVDEYGQPTYVEGVVLDENSKVVSKFNSLHDGMGSFDLSVKRRKKYTVKITKPAGVEQIFELPKSSSRGFVIQKESEEKSEIIFKCFTTENEAMTAVVRMNGKIIASKGLLPPSSFVKINTKNLPTGVAQITVFDSYNVPRVERLFFVNKDKILNVEIKTDKENYKPNEKVSMMIEVKDEQGRGVEGQFALSITGGKFNNGKGNILSTLLLESELKGKINNPNFYFEKDDSESVKRNVALDNLMLTNDWKRFYWESILFDPKVGNLDYFSERESIELPTQVEHSSKSVYWNPSIKTGVNGQATIELEAPDSEIPFQVILEGIGTNGQIGYGIKVLNVEK